MTTAAAEPKLGISDILGPETDNPPTPRGSGECFFALGEEWQLAGDELRIKGQLEQWCRRRAAFVIRQMEHQDREPGDSVASYRREHLTMRGAGAYNWGGSACIAALNEPLGLQQLCFLLMRRCHPTVTEEVAYAAFLEDPQAAQRAMTAAMGNWKAPSVQEAPTGTRGTVKKVADPATMD